jgi:FAD/FMN-containing dehydrogenase
MLPLRTDLDTRARYAQAGGIHRIIPAAVARPTSIDALHEAMRWAQERGLAITPRGAGSAMSGSAVGEGMILDLTALNDGVRCEVVPELGVVRAVAGVTLGEIDAAAAPHGLRLGPNPSSAEWATVGGTISTNAAGARSYRLGAMDRWVQSLILHTTDGPLPLARHATPAADHPVVRRFETDAAPALRQHRDAVLARWPRTRKNTAGYGLDRYWHRHQLLDLVIGSEGTLGLITRAELRLERVPAHRAALRIALADRRDLEAAVSALSAAAPTSIELLDRSLLLLVAHRIPEAGSSALWRHAAALLLVDLEDDDAAALADRVAQCLTALRSIAIDVRAATRPEEAAELWSVRHHASPALAAIADGRRSLQVIEDGCVPTHQLGKYLDAVDAACTAAAIDAVMFGHAGDGHVHVNLLPDPSEPDWKHRTRQVLAAVSDALLALGGTPAGEHGAGRLRAGLLEPLLGPEAMTCFGVVKQAFDPQCLFNPGVILPDGRDPLADLKVGSDAVALPPGHDATLRRIEEERRWGESRWNAGEG